MSCIMGTSIDGYKPFWLPACFVRINSLYFSYVIHTKQAVVRGTTNPAPVLPRSQRQKNSNFITFSVARWQHRTARRPQSNQITMAGDNKLTFDPPTRLPGLTQNLIRSSHGHSTPSQKISCKSVQPFSRNVQRNKSTKKQKNRSKTIPRPRSYLGRGKYLFFNVYSFITA